MATFKCKICGGDLDVIAGQSVCECMYCGTKQSLPKFDNDEKLNLFERANHFMRNNDFDKASSVYEKILELDSTEAEAYWSLVLCSYGVLYVEDPKTHKRIPTVNRTKGTSVMSNENYKKAMEYGDFAQREVFEADAHTIDEIQKGIMKIAQNEEPFDVFICYKETDSGGKRTKDSVLAQDLYYQLTNEGFKVFFARITLEDKLGSAYEPYIFAALNSSKVMVVLGTQPEHFNAVWVKNEWSRFLPMCDGINKILIPAYRDMDAYDLPMEFSHLQAQDMSKLGFMQDLIRGIKKIVESSKPKKESTTIIQTNAASPSIENYMKRIRNFLADEDWDEAFNYCDKVLDLDPDNGEAYVFKLMARLEISEEEDLALQKEPLTNFSEYKNALRLCSEKRCAQLRNYNLSVLNIIEQANNELQEQKRLADAKRCADEAKQRVYSLQQTISDLENKIGDCDKELSGGEARRKRVKKLAQNMLIVFCTMFLTFILFLVLAVTQDAEELILFVVMSFAINAINFIASVILTYKIIKTINPQIALNKPIADGNLLVPFVAVLFLSWIAPLVYSIKILKTNPITVSMEKNKVLKQELQSSLEDAQKNLAEATLALQNLGSNSDN